MNRPSGDHVGCVCSPSSNVTRVRRAGRSRRRRRWRTPAPDEIAGDSERGNDPSSAPAATKGRRDRTGGGDGLDSLRCRRPAVAPQPREIGAEIARALVAQLAILLERLVEDAIELRRHRADSPCSAAGGVRLRMPSKIRPVVVTLERQRARGHLVHHDAEREDVRARVELFAAHLLRRHVGRPCPSSARRR